MNIKNKFKDYWNLQDSEKLFLLKEAYSNEKMSWIQIANALGTYPNKIRREAKRLGIQSRTKSTAQKEALKSGRSLHPTEGKALTGGHQVKNQRVSGFSMGQPQQKKNALKDLI